MARGERQDVLNVRTNYMIEEIPFSSLRYMLTEDKVTKVCTKRQKLMLTYMTLSELTAQLPDEQFLQISRNCVVAMSAIEEIESDFIRLYSGETLQFSQRRKSVILKKYNEYINTCLGSKQGKTPPKNEEIKSAFASFDNFPIAFAVIEMSTDKWNKNVDFISRYGNEALATLEGIPLDKLINKSFYSIFPDSDSKWREVYAETALNGTNQEFISYSEEIGKYLKIQCYQPFFGYCACMISDMGKDAALLGFSDDITLSLTYLKEGSYPKLKKTLKKMLTKYTVK